MSGVSTRRGKEWEREVARTLSDLEHIEAERILDEPRDGLVGDVRANVPLSIQAKAGKRPRIYDALEEAQEAAQEAAGPGEHPVAAVKRSHGSGIPADRMAVLPWGDFLEIVGLLRAMGGW